VIATKAGLERPGPDHWVPNGRPEYLIAACKASLKRLGLERIDLWQLHRIDPRVPRDEQFGAVRKLIDEGYIRFAGLSQASIEEIEAASRAFPVATVQNRYSLEDTGSDAVLAHCERRGIGFIPWYPLAAGALAKGEGEAATKAAKLGATPSQYALAWLLQRSPVMLPIPGTSKVRHLEENAAAAALQLGSE
jgi:aryl-alcohol dehydrogenase-like predicted oxidoreductase